MRVANQPNNTNKIIKPNKKALTGNYRSAFYYSSNTQKTFPPNEVDKPLTTPFTVQQYWDSLTKRFLCFLLSLKKKVRHHIKGGD
jgi:hypothetical protein